MEVTLTRQAGTRVAVTCDSQFSHTFDLLTLVPDNEKGPPHPLADPVAYGKALYAALFPPETPARRALESMPERLLLVTTDNDLDAVPWEYAYGPDGFLVLECHFVRGLPADQRINPPVLDSGLHIVAVPSNPLSHEVEPLNIDGEWMRLKEIIQELPYAITLERTRPPTLERTRHLVANQKHRIVHFMGHGGQDEKQGAILCFEQDNGDLDPVTAKDFTRRVRGTVFLVTLNACASATPGDSHLSNLAGELVRQKTPYALGMRFIVPDKDALTFSRAFYGDLARGSSVEEAVYQARLALSKSPCQWVVGVPVLYTALSAPASGCASIPGTPAIKDDQPRREVSALPRAEGAFQGRIEELKQLGTALTGDSRSRIVTIHGGGGQGKTALAREAVERFAYAWPGGSWATTLENLPSREVFVNELARFLGINIQEVPEPAEIERQVLIRLIQQRTLLVLDNAETLVDAVERNDALAIQLVQFIQQLPSPTVSLLVTSRVQLGWPGEVPYELGGLSSEEGAALFRLSAPARAEEVDMSLAQKLSQKVAGHPLSLRLLGGAFNASPIKLQTFLEEHEEQLVKAENKYVGEEHRHRTLYASIETSVRYLDTHLRALLSRLWVFHAPFLPETAVAIFDPRVEDVEGTESEGSPIYDRLYTLWQRGLLTRETITLREGTLRFYRLLPTMRPYVEHYLAQADERETLLARFGAAYAQLVRFLYNELDRGSIAAYMALQFREDLERGASYVTGVVQGYYWLRWGWVLQRLVDRQHGLKLTEQALEIGQEQDKELELRALNNMAGVYHATGRPQEALKLYEQALPLMREVGERAGEAATLNDMALVYQAIGQPKEALRLYEEALPIRREVGNRAGEARTLNNMAEVYRRMGQSQEAFKRYEQALPLMREVGDRAGEATTLNNIALVYRGIGQPQEALKLHEQALPITREVRDWAGEARTLNNLAGVYQAIGQPKEALRLYEQALPIRREVGDRAGEGATLNNLAGVYQAIGQPKEALRLYEQALPLMREVGDRAGEAATLNGLAYLYQSLQRYTEALTAFEQSILLSQQITYPAAEVAGLVGLAMLLYQHLNRPQEAITAMEQAVAVLRETGLPQDAAGQTAEDLQRILQAMRTAVPPGGQAGSSSTMPEEQIQPMIANTIAVMTTVPDRRTEWREVVAHMLQDAQQRGADRQIEVDFFTAVLDILDGRSPTLPADHPYAQAVAAIQKGIAAGGVQNTEISDDKADEMIQAVRDFVNAEDWGATRQVVQARQALLFQPEVETLFEQNIVQAKASGNQRAARMLELHLTILRDCKAHGIPATFEQIAAAQQADLPFDAELIPRSIAALLGGPQQRMEHAQYLATQAAQATDEELKALINTIQLALFGGSLSQLGQNLSGIYRQAWEAIVTGVETTGGTSS